MRLSLAISVLIAVIVCLSNDAKGFDLGKLGLDRFNINSIKKIAGGLTKFIKFENGGRINIKNIKTMLQRGKTHLERIQRKSRTARNLFREIDRFIKTDQTEQNARSLVGGTGKNEFVDSNEASEQALENEAQTSELLEKNGVDARGSFDANGNPTDAGVGELVEKVEEVEKKICVFDSPNAQPCELKFREPTGRCTNIEEGRRTWGMSQTPFARLVPPRYEDDIKEVRKTEFKSAKPLKSPRQISESVTRTQVVLNVDGVSAHIMQWGQFISHEFTLLGELEEDVVCCPDKVFAQRNGKDKTPTRPQLETIREDIKEVRGHVCMPVEHTNDTVFGDYICMEQTRSKPSPLHDCALGPRQQMNFVTHVFDGSAIYGSSLNESQNLRSLSGGKMKVQTVNGVTLPPPNHDDCESKPKDRCPFAAGDHRINTTPNLIAEHTLFLVVHNKIAEQLSSLNSHWDDERLYQETRRIVAGIQGNIHYYEYIPIVVGQAIVNKYKLGTFDGFDSDVNPSTLNELAGAAMRYGHSLIDGLFSLVFDDGTDDFINLRPQFFNSTTIYNGGIRQCIRGLMKDIPWKGDRHFPTQMRNELFDQDRDIVSLNINRGRDHGFASYMDYRRHYGLSVPKSWDELLTTHPENVRDDLKKIYTTVEDIELYIGGVTEKVVAEGLVGELFANIIADGFSRTRKGDRFWFENGDSGLNKDQIDAIKGYKYNQLMCEGSGIEQVPSKGFFTTRAPSVSLVQCSSLPKLNLSLWKETPVSDNCSWKKTSVGKCCAGKRKVVRTCEGQSATCKCTGKATINEDCTCAAYDTKCWRRMNKKNCGKRKGRKGGRWRKI